ncbi:MAG: nitrous oxide reductase family maturation protein NosD, partial [Actinomycetes bacterium]
MRGRRRILARAVAIAACAALTVTGAASCGGGGTTGTIVVPSDAPTIQAAVDDAAPGATILIEPGTYRESVLVETPNLLIRGLDRNRVVLDGGFRTANGIEVDADGVAVQNLTVRHFTQNGVVFAGTPPEFGTETSRILNGYRVDHVTAYNNGLYGVYAFGARNGLIQDVYASGHPSSGVYVGRCKPCNVVVRRVVAERNAIGYYGTNASGDVYIVESVFRRNRLGVAPNSQNAERLAPQSRAVVAANLVENNDDPATPEIPEGFFGGGIAVGGGERNLITKNRVRGHVGFGIGVLVLGEFAPALNVVRDNVVEGNGTDLYLRTPKATLDGNCFEGNTFSTADPPDIQQLARCGAAPTSKVPAATFVAPVPPPGVSYKKVVAPGPQSS